MLYFAHIYNSFQLKALAKLCHLYRSAVIACIKKEPLPTTGPYNHLYDGSSNVNFKLALVNTVDNMRGRRSRSLSFHVLLVLPKKSYL